MAYWPIRRRSIRLSGGLDSLLARNALCWSEETSAHLQKHVLPSITICKAPFFCLPAFFVLEREKKRDGGSRPIPLASQWRSARSTLLKMIETPTGVGTAFYAVRRFIAVYPMNPGHKRVDAVHGD
jgi:hypothetical protein